MPLTYFKCADTLLAYCNKSIPEEPSLWFAKPSDATCSCTTTRWEQTATYSALSDPQTPHNQRAFPKGKALLILFPCIIIIIIRWTIINII